MRVTIKYGPANSLTKEYPQGTTVRAVIQDRNNKLALGYGDNVQVSIDHRHVDLDYPLGSDVELSLETIANRKAAEVTISYGPANSLTKEVADGTTIGQIKRDRSILNALGAGQNVKALVDGVEQSDNSPVDDGDEIVLETVANTKAQA